MHDMLTKKENWRGKCNAMGNFNASSVKDKAWGCLKHHLVHYPSNFVCLEDIDFVGCYNLMLFSYTMTFFSCDTRA
jgi:hypothetical protein